MSSGPRQLRGISRRAVLAAFPLLLPAQSPAKGQTLPSDWARYPDPSTELEVLRLTSPEYESLLPPPPSRSITGNSAQVLCLSTRSGRPQAHLLQLRDGRSRVLTSADSLQPGALTLTHDDRALLFFDGPALLQSPLSGLREQQIAKIREGYQREAGPVCSSDGLFYYFVESRDGESELRRVRRPSNAVETIARAPGILDPTPNPRRAMICWRNRDGELFTATIDGQNIRRVETPPGRVLQAFWSPDGQALLYLLDPAESGQLAAIREQHLDSRTDSLVAKTSQYVAFMPNANATVFLGSSRSKVNPSILIMLRITRRELILCDHAAAVPAATSPVFAPNSQRIVFQSERHGRPALYSMMVEGLLEKTGT
ncbi:MAG: PD40 domain-containing protein [Bryobacteraceae bacterium]|nr:PD40 domain-containing protein [Bryobacteraceae bacterium]